MTRVADDTLPVPSLRALVSATLRDGCVAETTAALEAALAAEEPGPRAVLLDTVKGKGVSFMENRLEWHYLPLDDELYAQARREVEGS